MDVYRITDKLEPATLAAMARRLEMRGEHPVFARLIERYLDALDLSSVDSLIDIGCGTGVVSRRIANRRDFSGRVTGVDISPYLIDEARRLAAELGLGDRLGFELSHQGDIAASERSYDAAVIHTVLSHVDRPDAVLRETARIVRPNGRIVVFDGDFASIAFAPGRTSVGDFSGAVVTNRFVMRDMPRLARSLGLEILRFMPEIIAEAGAADFWRPALEAMRTFIPASGLADASEAHSWTDELLQASENGEFFGACCYYSYILRVPAQ
jgi:ubiquinone/menaquinone biosynthesis C-methylase UbiE